MTIFIKESQASGMVYDQNVSYLYVLSGPAGKFNRADVGALGFIDEFGFLGLVWYVSVIVICSRSYYKAKVNGDNAQDLLVLLLYFIFGSGTLCMMDSERNIMFPILMHFQLRILNMMNLK